MSNRLHPIRGALDLMARAGEVIEDMQAKGELAVRGGDKKSKSQRVTLILEDVLGDNAKNKSSRYKTAAKASRDESEDQGEWLRA